MKAVAVGTSPTSSLISELHHADHIIKAMLNAMTAQQKARVGAQLEAAGVAGDGITRHHERVAAIAAATAAPTNAGAQGASKHLRDIEARAVDVLTQADHADVLLQAVFDKLDEAGPAAPGAAAVNCFTTCTARAVLLMREAADNIVALVEEGGAA